MLTVNVTKRRPGHGDFSVFDDRLMGTCQITRPHASVTKSFGARQVRVVSAPYVVQEFLMPFFGCICGARGYF